MGKDTIIQNLFDHTTEIAKPTTVSSISSSRRSLPKGPTFMASSTCAGVADPVNPIPDSTIEEEKCADEVPHVLEGGSSLSNISLWARWALVSILSIAIPFYKASLKIEGDIENLVEVLVEDVEKVAVVVQKAASEIADALPVDSIVENDFVLIEHFAEQVIEKAEKVEAFIQEVDEMKEEFEKKVEPYVERGEEIIDEQGKAE